MLPPGYDPAVAATPPASELYFPSAASVTDPGQVYLGGGRSDGTGAQAVDAAAPELFFGNTGNYTGKGEPIKHASQSSKGHYSEIINFHGSPAPWVLLGILLVAGIMHLSAEGKLGVSGGV
jgi:hypothetical protein